MDIEKIMKELTLAEKAYLVSGNSSWTVGRIEGAGIPEIFVSDGPYGLRKQDTDTAEIYDSMPLHFLHQLLQHQVLIRILCLRSEQLSVRNVRLKMLPLYWVRL